MKTVAGSPGARLARCTLTTRRFAVFVSTFLSLCPLPGWPHPTGKSVVRHFWWLLCLSRHPFNGKAVRGQRWGQQVSNMFTHRPEYRQDSLNCLMYFTVNGLLRHLYNCDESIYSFVFVPPPFFFSFCFFCLCRAIIVRNNEVIPMTNEFTPESERQRLQYLVFLPLLHPTFYHHAPR